MPLAAGKISSNAGSELTVVGALVAGFVRLSAAANPDQPRSCRMCRRETIWLNRVGPPNQFLTVAKHRPVMAGRSFRKFHAEWPFRGRRPVFGRCEHTRWKAGNGPRGPKAAS